MIGQYLRSKRDELSLSLKEISEKTRIRISYLQAIEEENFDKIPGRVFIKGYVRQYCRALSIPETEAINILTEDLEEYFKPLEEEPAVVERKKSLSIRLLYPAAVILIVLSIGLYYKSKERIPIQLAQDRTEVTEQDKTSSNALSEQNTPIASESTSQDGNIKIPSPLGTAEADYSGKHILEVETVKETWIFINIDNKLKYSMILKPGEVRSWSGRNTFFMRVGNAGGIRITYDGQALGSPGRMGEVVSLTLPDELERFRSGPSDTE